MECIGFIAPDNKVVVVVMNRGDDLITFKLLDELSGGKQAVKMEALPHSILHRFTSIWLCHCTLGTVMQVRITLQGRIQDLLRGVQYKNNRARSARENFLDHASFPEDHAHKSP